MDNECCRKSPCYFFIFYNKTNFYIIFACRTALGNIGSKPECTRFTCSNLSLILVKKRIRHISRYMTYTVLLIVRNTRIKMRYRDKPDPAYTHWERRSTYLRFNCNHLGIIALIHIFCRCLKSNPLPPGNIKHQRIRF